jgi:hypothetical protein
VLRELETVVMSDAAYRKLRVNFDADWVKVYAEQRLQSWFDHDLVFVIAASIACSTLRSVAAVRPELVQLRSPDLKPMLDVYARAAGFDADGKVMVRRGHDAKQLPHARLSDVSEPARDRCRDRGRQRRRGHQAEVRPGAPGHCQRQWLDAEFWPRSPHCCNCATCAASTSSRRRATSASSN